MTQSLENKINRRTALVGLVAGVLAAYGCTKQKDPAQVQRDKDIENYKQMVEDRHSYNEFKKALGDRYVQEKEDELKEFWREGDKPEKLYMNGEELIINARDEFRSIYLGLENSQIYRNVMKHEKEAYEKFHPTNEDFQRVNKQMPWKISAEKITESDKLILYFGNKLKSLENPLEGWNIISF